MKTIGLLGGMSWQSSVSYYQTINQEVHRRLGGLNSAKLILNSVNFSLIEQLQHRGEWGETARLLSIEAQNIERAGADCLVIGTTDIDQTPRQLF